MYSQALFSLRDIKPPLIVGAVFSAQKKRNQNPCHDEASCLPIKPINVRIFCSVLPSCSAIHLPAVRRVQGVQLKLHAFC